MTGLGSVNPDTPMRVVVAGGGVAGLEAAIALHTLAGPRVDITLLSPDEDFVYRPLSVGEPFALGPARRVPLAQVARDLDLRHRQEPLRSVDPDRHVVSAEVGSEVPYDVLIVALGAERTPAYDHAITFRGQEDAEALHGLVLDVEEDYSHKVTFVVPAGTAWALPIYELALMTAQRARDSSIEIEITLVTPEERPLEVFGAQAATDVATLLDGAGIRVHTASTADIPSKGTVVVRPAGETLTEQRIVALPRVVGRPVEGLPSDNHGFIPVDRFMRVSGIEDVYAAGDGTMFPLKQGGLACQQADVAANEIARRVGVPVEQQPFHPVLRGQLLTGGKPHFMRRTVGAPSDQDEASGEHVLWWPPAKIAGRYLAPYLAARENVDAGTDALESVQELNLGTFKFAER